LFGLLLLLGFATESFNILLTALVFITDWQQFVSNKLKGWEMMNLSWARNFTGSIKVVFYDDLVHHTERELRSILDFLQFPINEQLMRCAIMRKEGIFRRKKRLLSFDPYTESMRAEVQNRRRIVYGLLGRQEP